FFVSKTLLFLSCALGFFSGALPLFLREAGVLLRLVLLELGQLCARQWSDCDFERAAAEVLTRGRIQEETEFPSGSEISENIRVGVAVFLRGLDGLSIKK